MRAVLPHLCALVLGVAAAVAVGCGSSDSGGLIPPGRADSLREQIGRVQDAASSRSCTAKDRAIAQARSSIQRLSTDVDTALVQRLEDGLARLDEQATEACAGPPATTTESIPTTEEVEPTTPSTQESEPTEPTTPTDTGDTDSTAPEDPSQADPGAGGGGIGPGDPGTDPGDGTTPPDAGGASPGPGTGDGSGFRGTRTPPDRDFGGRQGYYP